MERAEKTKATKLAAGVYNYKGYKVSKVDNTNGGQSGRWDIHNPAGEWDDRFFSKRDCLNWIDENGVAA